MKSFKKLISFNNHKGKEKRDSLPLDSATPKHAVADEFSKEMRITQFAEEAKLMPVTDMAIRNEVGAGSRLPAADVPGSSRPFDQELIEMRHNYEGLCAVSSVVSTRALDFASAIQDLATYFIETFGSSKDGEMSKVFKIVGRVQFEISKILDLYGIHISETITEPTQILLSELRNVQDSKQQHDEKRHLYENLRARIGKGRPKNGKGEAFADQQLQVVKDEFDRLSLYVNTRLSSLEEGQSRSLIAQAARHHASQMHLFSRGHSSLQAVDPYMRQVVRERNIDRQLSGRITDILDPEDESDNKSEDDVSYIDESDNSSDAQSVDQSNRWDSHAVSSGRRPSGQDEEAEVPKNLSKEWNSLLSKLNRSGPHLRGADMSGSGSRSFTKLQKSGLYDHGDVPHRSLPVSPTGGSTEQDTVQVTKVGEESTSTYDPLSPPRRLPPDIPSEIVQGYDGVGSSIGISEINLPTVSTSSRTSVERRAPSDASQGLHGIVHNDSSSVASIFNHNSGLSPEAFRVKFSSASQKPTGPTKHSSPVEAPPVLNFVSPTLSSTPVRFTTNTKEAIQQGRRFTQSGPLTYNGTPLWVSQPPAGNTPLSQSVSSSDVHKSGPLGRSPLGRTFGSPRISPSMSPPRMSPPRISELHKLPPPPLNPIKTKSPRTSPIIAHSAPLSRQEPLGLNVVHATPLPPPPLGSVPRSQSLPSRQKQFRSKAPSIAQVPEVNEAETPTSSQELTATNITPLATNVQRAHKRVLSGNIPGQETGLPLSDLKFVHFNAARSASGTPTLSSLQVRLPSPAAMKSQQLDGRRAEPLSQSGSPLTSGGAVNPPRWRSLSINDKDSYISGIAGAATLQRDFAPELVSFNRT